MGQYIELVIILPYSVGKMYTNQAWVQYLSLIANLRGQIPELPLEIVCNAP